MLRGYRHHIATAFRLAIYLLIAVGFLSVVWQISGHYAERRQDAEHRARQYADTTDRRVARACAGVERSAVLECVTEQVKATREDERTEYDLQAQQDSAEAAFWVALISFASLTATLVALWFVKGTLDATLEAVEDTGRATEAMVLANQIAEETGNRQLRAYVGVTDFQVNMVSPGQRPFFRAKYVNAGQTPARHLSCRGYLKFTYERPDKVRFEKMTPELASVMTLMPGSDGWCELQTSAPISFNEMADLIAGRATFVFAGYVVYRDVFGVRHFTNFRHCLVASTIQENGYAKIAAVNRGNDAT